MKKAIAKKWVAALRSGEYVQTKGALCKEGKRYDSFCCLGVLTELYIQDHNAKKKNANNQIGWESECSFSTKLMLDGYSGVPPCVVKEWAGIRTNGGVLDKHTKGSLVDLNDTGFSFHKIAEVIEKNVDTL